MVIFDKLNILALFANVSCTGTAESIKYSAVANLSQVQGQLGQFISFGKYEMAGQLDSDGEVLIKKEKITAAGKAGIKELKLSSTEGVTAVEPDAKIDFAVAYEPDKKTAAVDTLKADASFGQLSVKDAVLPMGKEATVPMKFDVSASNIDLAKLQPFMVLFASFPKDMQLAGLAASQVSVTSRKDTYYIATDSTAIKNLSLIYPGQQPFQQTEVLLAFDVEVNPVLKTLAVKKLQLTSPQIKIKGTFQKTIEGNEGKLEGQANLDYDWAAISTIAAPYLPKGLHIKGQRTDTVKFSSKYPAAQPDKMLANLNARAKTGFAGADYKGLIFGPTEVEVMAQNGILLIPPFSSPVNNGQLNFAAETDFKQKPVFMRTPAPIQVVKDVQITDQMGKELLVYVNPIFANVTKVSGLVNFNCEKFALPIVGGTKNDIEIVGTVSADKINLGSGGLLGQLLAAIGDKFAGQEITIHPTRFALQQGYLQYDNMQVDVGNGPFNFKGAIGLDKTLNMSITVPYGPSGRVTTQEMQTASRYTVPLRGTTDNPQLDMAKLLADMAKEAAGTRTEKKPRRLVQKIKRRLCKSFGSTNVLLNFDSLRTRCSASTSAIGTEVCSIPSFNYPSVFGISRWSITFPSMSITSIVRRLPLI